MDRRAGGEGEERRWGVADGGGSVRRGRRRNVHEFFSFYCTFSIILRNSGKEAERCAELLICEQCKVLFCFYTLEWKHTTKKTTCRNQRSHSVFARVGVEGGGVGGIT